MDFEEGTLFVLDLFALLFIGWDRGECSETYHNGRHDWYRRPAVRVALLVGRGTKSVDSAANPCFAKG